VAERENCPGEFCPGYLTTDSGYEGALHCNTCGKTPEQAKAKNKEIEQWKQKQEADMTKRVKLDLNAMTEQLKTMKVEDVAQEHGINRATIYNYQKKGLLPRSPLQRGGRSEGMLAKHTGTPPVERVTKALNNSQLPAFPEWDDNWQKEVQVAWLQAYAEVRKLNNIK
jgi:predicted DNA-binding transcriptional regulator AlpA